MERYDVVVVGAGPSGAMAAKYAAIGGAKTLILEEHAVVGEPVECAGLISKRAMEACEVRPSPNFVKREIRGAFIYSPDCDRIEIDAKETKAYVIERRIFDRLLVEEAIKHGTDIHLKTKVVGYRRERGENIIKVVRDGELTSLSSSVIIGADGVKSVIAKIAGLGCVRKLLPGAQFECPYDIQDPDLVEVFTGGVAPGFFAWVIPTGDGVARIGLCSEGRPLFYLRRMISKHPVVSESYGGSISDLVIGGIPIGALKRTVSDGLMIVGDAAGQVKPTSGGGIYTGALCAKLAGEVAAKAVMDGDTTSKRLRREYEREWKRMIGRELAIGMTINKMVGRMRDNDFDRILHTIDARMLKIITECGDMDHPSTLIRGLLTRPMAWPSVMKICVRLLV